MSESVNPYASPSAVEQPAFSPKTSTAFPAAPYVPAHTRANFALAATAFLMLMHVLLVGSMLMQIVMLSSADGFDAAAADANDRRQMAISFGVIFGAIASFITLLVWIYAAQKNLPALQPSKTLEFSPGWSVGWFFIPIMNLFKPFQAMRQLWNESDPAQLYLEGKPRPMVPPATLVGWWWGLRIVGAIAGRVLTNMEDQTTVESLIAVSWGAIALTVALDFPLLVCQWFLIRGVQTNQELRFAKIEQAAASTSAMLPTDATNSWSRFQ